MTPEIQGCEYVFCTVQGVCSEYAHLNPLACYMESEGLTAAVDIKLSSYGISANVVAAYYHDHIFVPSEKANEALLTLQEFSVKKQI